MELCKCDFRNRKSLVAELVLAVVATLTVTWPTLARADTTGAELAGTEVDRSFDLGEVESSLPQDSVAILERESNGVRSSNTNSSALLNNTAPRDDEFTFIVSPYVWIPSVSGDIGLGTQGFNFALDAGDLLDVFEFGGLIRGEVRHKSGWGVAIDYIFADLGTDVEIFIGDVNADIDAEILELTAIRRFESGRDSFDVYGGIRHWDAGLDATITTAFFDSSIQTGDNWIDPIVGARYLHPLSRRWRLIAQGDIGGFGVGSEFSWNAAAGISYATSESASFQLVYRILHVNRESRTFGASSSVDLDITIQGPLIGFAFRF